MFFPRYLTQFSRTVEDVYLPGDADIYAPVVLRSRSSRRRLEEDLDDHVSRLIELLRDY